MKNKTVRKALSVLCVLALMMSLSAAVFAGDSANAPANTEGENGGEPSVCGVSVPTAKRAKKDCSIVSIYVPTSTEVENDENPTAYSLYDPTEEFEITNKDYEGSFAGLTGSLSTNYWFRCNSGGEIFVEAHTSRACDILLHDLDDKKISVRYSIPEEETTAIRFYNLYSNHRYYFEFQNPSGNPTVDTVSGYFTVSHSNPNF